MDRKVKPSLQSRMLTSKDSRCTDVSRIGSNRPSVASACVCNACFDSSVGSLYLCGVVDIADAKLYPLDTGVASFVASR